MAFNRKKIAVIGSGFTGATTAFILGQKELGDVVLVDIPQLENPTKGKALDMMESSPVLGFDAQITGTASYEDIQGADLVIITAGIARKPGMSRDDLVNTNASIMKSVAEQVKTYAPNSIVLVLSNPVDAMTYTFFKTSGFPKERVIGQSGVLDTARFRTFVAMELNVSVEDVTGFVLGGHGDDMVPLVRYSYAGGIPLETLIPKDRLDAIVERTRKGGGEIVNLLGNGSAYYALKLPLSYRWRKRSSRINDVSFHPLRFCKASTAIKIFTSAFRPFWVQTESRKSSSWNSPQKKKPRSTNRPTRCAMSWLY